MELENRPVFLFEALGGPAPCHLRRIPAQSRHVMRPDTVIEEESNEGRASARS